MNTFKSCLLAIAVFFVWMAAQMVFFVWMEVSEPYASSLGSIVLFLLICHYERENR
jgi:hypothetical protein